MQIKVAISLYPVLHNDKFILLYHTTCDSECGSF